MKIKTVVAAVILLAVWITQSVAGGIVFERTRVIYDARKKETALSLSNHSEKMPWLLQSWVDDAAGQSRGLFIVTPPLFRLDAGDNSSLRIIKTDGELPENKESLFYINVRAIPAQNKTEISNANLLTLVFKTRVKLFYRPRGLQGKAHDAYKTLEFKRENNTLNIYNPSDYYVVFAGLAVGNTDLTDNIEYISPGEHKQLALPIATGNTVKWAAINDYGGHSKTESRTLQ